MPNLLAVPISAKNRPNRLVRIVRARDAASGWNCTQKTGLFVQPQALQRAVVERQVGDLHPSAGRLARLDDVIVVLGGDPAPRRVRRSRTGWLPPWWPNLSRRSAPPSARPINWWPRQIPKTWACRCRGVRPTACDDLRQPARIAGAVGKENPIRLQCERFLRRRVRRDHGDLAPHPPPSDGGCCVLMPKS